MEEGSEPAADRVAEPQPELTPLLDTPTPPAKTSADHQEATTPATQRQQHEVSTSVQSVRESVAASPAEPFSGDIQAAEPSRSDRIASPAATTDSTSRRSKAARTVDPEALVNPGTVAAGPVTSTPAPAEESSGAAPKAELGGSGHIARSATTTESNGPLLDSAETPAHELSTYPEIVEADQVAAAPPADSPGGAAAPATTEETAEIMTPGVEGTPFDVVRAKTPLDKSADISDATGSTTIHREPRVQAAAGRSQGPGETPVEFPEDSSPGETITDTEVKTSDPLEPTHQQDEQLLPLEAVWPVQTTRPVQRQPGDSPPEVTPTPLEATDSPSTPDSDEIARVEAALQKVSAGRPTDSSIELVPPRGRKPGSPTQVARKIADTAELTAPEGRPSPAAPVQRQTRRSGEASVPAGPSIAHASIWRQSPAQASESHEPTTVATEIGPLPADLWQLLGKTPPSPTPARPKTTETVTPPAAVQAKAIDTPEVIQRVAPADPSDAPTQSPPRVLYKPSASDVQGTTPGVPEPARSVAPTQVASALVAAERSAPAEAESAFEAADEVRSGASVAMRSSAEPTAEEVEATPLGSPMGNAEEQDEEQEGSELAASDLDNLAGLVYQEIKRRLSLEKERGRGRF